MKKQDLIKEVTSLLEANPSSTRLRLLKTFLERDKKKPHEVVSYDGFLKSLSPENKNLFNEEWFAGNSPTLPFFKKFKGLEIESATLTKDQPHIFKDTAELTIKGDLAAGVHVEIIDGFIRIRGNVGKGCKVIGEHGVYIYGDIERECEIVSEDGIIIAQKRIGDKCIFKAKDIFLQGEKGIDVKQTRIASSQPNVSAEQQEKIKVFRSEKTQLNEIYQSKYITAKLDEWSVPEKLNKNDKDTLRLLYQTLQFPNISAHVALLKKLRPQQINFLIEYCNATMKNKPHAVVMQATGSGKTVAMAALASLLINYKKTKNKILILVPRISLIEQTINTFNEYTPHLNIAVYDRRSNWHSDDVDVVICTMQTVINRNFVDKEFPTYNGTKKFKDFFTRLFLDEVHNFLGEKGSKTVTEAFIKNNVPCLGFTATPVNDARKPEEDLPNSAYKLLGYDRPDLNPISPFTMNMAAEQKIIVPVCNGLVRPVISEELQRQLNKEAGGTQATYGDLNEANVADLIDTDEFNNMIVSLYANGINPKTGVRFIDQQGMSFASTVNHAENLAAAYRKGLPIENDPFLKKKREEFVERSFRLDFEKYIKEKNIPDKLRAVSEKDFKKTYDFKKLRDSFRVAEAIHAGRYSLYIDKVEVIEQVLATGTIIYKSKETDADIVYHLTPKEKESLKKQFEKHTAGKVYRIKVGKKLREADQEEIIERYKRGGILNLVGAAMLREGFDNRRTKFIINVMPTKSTIVEIQRSGRAARLDPENPNSVATVIDIDYNFPGQLFLKDITGAWQLGKIKEKHRVKSNENIPTYNIQGQIKHSEIIWQNDNVLRITKHIPKARMQHSTAQSIAETEIERNVEDMLKKIDKYVADLLPMMNKLEDRLSTITAIEKAKPNLKRSAPGPSHSNLSNKKHVKYVSEGVQTRSYEAKLKEVAKSTNELNEKIQNIIDALEQTADADSTEALKSKRKRVESSEPSGTNTANKEIINETNAVEVHEALNKLKSLQSKLQSLQSGKVGTSYSNSSETQGSDNIIPIEETDIDDIHHNLGLIIAELETTSFNALNQVVEQSLQQREEKRKQKIEQAKIQEEAKAKSEAEAKAKAIVETETKVEILDALQIKTKTLIEKKIQEEMDSIKNLFTVDIDTLTYTQIVNPIIIKRIIELATSTNNPRVLLRIPSHLLLKYRKHIPSNIDLFELYLNNPDAYMEVALLKYFVSQNKNLAQVDNTGNTFLHRAAKHCNYVSMLYLIQTKTIDVNAKNNYGETALHVVGQYTDKKITEAFELPIIVLLANGADPNCRANPTPENIYGAATIDNFPDAVKLKTAGYFTMGYFTIANHILLSKDKPESLFQKLKFSQESVDKPIDDDQNTLLGIAVSSSDFIEHLHIAMAFGAKINAQNKKGQTPIYIAYKGQNKDYNKMLNIPLLRTLYAYGADHNIYASNNFCPLTHSTSYLYSKNGEVADNLRAFMEHKVELVGTMESAGVEVLSSGAKLIFNGVGNGISQNDFDRELRRNPFLVNYRDSDGNTIFHKLVMSKEQFKIEFCTKLMEYTASPFETNYEGKTCLDLADDKTKAELIKIYQEALEKKYRAKVQNQDDEITRKREADNLFKPMPIVDAEKKAKVETSTPKQEASKINAPITVSSPETQKQLLAIQYVRTCLIEHLDFNALWSGVHPYAVRRIIENAIATKKLDLLLKIPPHLLFRYHNYTPQLDLYDLYVKKTNGSIPLCLLKLFASLGKDLSYIDNHGNTLLHRAASASNASVILYLLKKNATDINAKNIYGQTALHQAAASQNRHTDNFYFISIITLLAYGADTTCKTTPPPGVADRLAFDLIPAELQSILKPCFDIATQKTPPPFKQPTLSVTKNAVDLFHIIFYQKELVDQPLDDLGNSFLAKFINHPDYYWHILVALACGANINRKNINGETVLHQIYKGIENRSKNKVLNYDLLKIIYRLGGDHTIVANDNCTPARSRSSALKNNLASFMPQKDLLLSYLETSGTPVLDGFADNIFNYSYKNVDLEDLKYTIESNPLLVSVRDLQGNTLLHKIISSNHPDKLALCNVLMDFTASPFEMNYAGETCLDLADEELKNQILSRFQLPLYNQYAAPVAPTITITPVLKRAGLFAQEQDSTKRPKEEEPIKDNVGNEPLSEEYLLKVEQDLDEIFKKLQ